MYTSAPAQAPAAAGFAEFYRANRRAVWAFVRRQGESEAACDDICADVFEIAFRELPPSHPNPTGWLIVTAAHTIRAAARRRRREAVAMHEFLALRQQPDADDPRVEHLAEAWRRLPRCHQEVLRLLVGDQLSAAEAAVVLRCSQQSVWKRASRARQALREAWPDEADASREPRREGAASHDLVVQGA